MGDFKWRGKSRYVAYVHLIFACLALCLSVFMLLAMILIAVENPDFDYRGTDNKDFMVAGVLLIVSMILLCLDLWAAVLLLKATKPEVDPEKALNKAQVWKNLCSAFLLVCIMFNMFIGNFIALFVGSIFRGSMMYIVYKFIDELEEAAYAVELEPYFSSGYAEIPSMELCPALFKNDMQT